MKKSQRFTVRKKELTKKSLIFALQKNYISEVAKTNALKNTIIG